MLAALPGRARHVFAWAGHEQRLAGLETAYVHVLLLSAGLKLAATAGEQFLLGVDRPFDGRRGVVPGRGGQHGLFAWALDPGPIWGSRRTGWPGSAWAQNVGVTSASC